MGIAFLVIGAVLLMVTAILSQTLTGKWKIFLWIVFTILLIAYTVVGINMELDRKVEKGKEAANVSALNDKNKQIYDLTQQLLNIVQSPNFGKSPETLSKIDEIKGNLSSIENKSKVAMQFTFCPDMRPPQTFIDTITVPIENGIVVVGFTVKNISTVQTNSGGIWIQLCDGCKFAEEPEGSIKVSLNPDTVRVKYFSSPFSAGLFLDTTKLKIIPPLGHNSFTLAFKYACDKCPPIDKEKPQILRVNY
jgi:hypothetical protein